jgi:hypothetical protein
MAAVPEEKAETFVGLPLAPELAVGEEEKPGVLDETAQSVLACLAGELGTTPEAMNLNKSLLEYGLGSLQVRGKWMSGAGAMGRTYH